MNAFVHVLMLACVWKRGYYVAFQSTAGQFYMDVYLKKAVDLISAMSTESGWVQQTYQMPWTMVLEQVLCRSHGSEIILWTNDFPGETGLTVGYRYLELPTKWYYAKVVVPCLSKWQMQLSYLNWGYKLDNYAWNFYAETDPRSTGMPFFYKPKSASIEDVTQWAVDHATLHGYEYMVPWIRMAIAYYRDHRW